MPDIRASRWPRAARAPILLGDGRAATRDFLPADGASAEEIRPMFRDALFASVIVLGAAGAAQAQAPSTWGGNVVGGGLAGTLHGGGGNAQVTYARPGAGAGGGMHQVQAGRTARFAGSDGSGPKFEYGPPAASDAGREAWVSGGGDDAQVTYGRRAR